MEAFSQFLNPAPFSTFSMTLKSILELLKFHMKDYKKHREFSWSKKTNDP